MLKTFNENKLYKHLLVDELRTDYRDLLLAGILLTEQYKLVKILPVLHEKENSYRKILLQNTKHNKNPDFRIDNHYWELESPKFPYRHNNIEARIRCGASQADNIILFFLKPVSINTIENAIHDRMKFNKDLKQVMIIANNKIETIIKRKTRKNKF